MKRKYIRGDIATRLAARSLPQENGCILFDGAIDNYGYGKIAYDTNRSARAHRVAWEIVHGIVPDGLCLCHTCDVRNCINVTHLFLGTRAENSADMASKGRGRPNGFSPVTPTEVGEFRRLREAGLTYQEIAKRVGRSKEPVWRALNAKT